MRKKPLLGSRTARFPRCGHSCSRDRCFHMEASVQVLLHLEVVAARWPTPRSQWKHCGLCKLGLALRALSNFNHSYSARIQQSSLLTFVLVYKVPEHPHPLPPHTSPRLLSLNRKGLWRPLLHGSGTAPRAENAGLLAIHRKVTFHRAKGTQVNGDCMLTEMGATEGCQARLW